MSNCKFSEKAYCKMILHVAKYPHCTVNGVLLAKLCSKSKEVEFVDAVPLLHISINLTPIAELALMQIDEFAIKKGLTIAGYYIAPDNNAREILDKGYHRIAEKISCNSNKSFLVVVNSINMTAQNYDMPLKITQCVEGSYKTCESSISFGSDNTLNTCKILLEKSFYNKLVDFDNHFDDIRLDWTNAAVDEEIEELQYKINI